MPKVEISFPDGGEAGVLVLRHVVKGSPDDVLEVRGKPYSEWDAADACDPLVQVHGTLHWNLITPLHAGEERTVADSHYYASDYQYLLGVWES